MHTWGSLYFGQSARDHCSANVAPTTIACRKYHVCTWATFVQRQGNPFDCFAGLNLYMYHRCRMITFGQHSTPSMFCTVAQSQAALEVVSLLGLFHVQLLVVFQPNFAADCSFVCGHVTEISNIVVCSYWRRRCVTVWQDPYSG